MFSTEKLLKGKVTYLFTYHMVNAKNIKIKGLPIM